MDKKPNILFLLTDDQRYNTIHALGNPQILTPNMDRLAACGTAFTQAHIPGGTSGAVCMPSRAMLNTGRGLFHIDREGQTIPDSFTTMGQCFRQNGYETFATGKWHNGTESFARSFSCGDNIFFGGMWDHWNVPVCGFDPSGQYDCEKPYTYDFMYANHPMNVRCDHYAAGIHSTDLLSGTAEDYLDAYNGDTPFLMYVAYLAPHDPRTMPKRFRELYHPDEIKLPPNFMREHPFDFGVSQIRDEVLTATPRDEAEIRRHLAEYYAMISHIDYRIGLILDKLEEKGLLDNTIIVLTGDNGLAIGSHGLMGKQNLYDHSVRVPLILSGPGVPKGQVCENYVYLYDIFPTLCDLSGLETPVSVEGASFAPMFADLSIKTRDTLYFVYCDGIRAVKNERYKLIEYAGTIRKTQLFDLATDPYETENLFGQPEYNEITAALRDEMLRYKRIWEDTGHRYSLTFWDHINGAFD